MKQESISSIRNNNGCQTIEIPDEAIFEAFITFYSIKMFPRNGFIWTSFKKRISMIFEKNSMKKIEPLNSIKNE